MRLRLPDHLDVVRTLRSLSEPGLLRFAGDGVWRATRTPDGPATLHLRARLGDDASIEAQAWGPGAERALASVPELLGMHDGPEQFRPRHPFVREAHRRHPGLRLGRTRSVVECLLPTIVAQKVPAADAARSWWRLRAAFADRAPGPAELSLPPDPARLAELGYHDLHRFGIDRKRAEPLLAACRAAPRLERLAHRSPDELARGLCQIRGVGPWTATKVARVVLGDPDTVVIGDYGFPSIVSWTLAGERRGDDDRMLELLEPERPHRARAMQLILAAGRTPPRHGPRLAPATISRRASAGSLSPSAPPRWG